MTAPDQVAVVTSTRAEYGLLRRLMREIEACPELDLRLWVTGSHLSQEFGDSLQEIEADGLPVAGTIPVLGEEDGPRGACSALARGCEGFGASFAEARPDLLVLLGDRYELMAPALAALLFQVPLAHIHGGELTLGAVDDAIRYGLTSLASLHFPATELARERILGLGEDPERVHWFGAPGLDDLLLEEGLPRSELARELDLDLGHPTAIVTFHPETRSALAAEDQLAPLLQALLETPVQLVFTGAGADPGGRAVNRRLAEVARENPARVRFFSSLGRRRYRACLEHLDLVAGNSSSGLLEAPCFGIPVLNVGDRQAGRERGPGVVDVANSLSEIRSALVGLAGTRRSVQEIEHPYLRFRDGSASQRICAALVRHLEAGIPLRKPRKDR